MSQLDLYIDDGSGREFDAVLMTTLPDGGDLRIITKQQGSKQGLPLAMLTFTVRIPSGEIRRVQTVVTMRNLLQALYALAGKYPEALERAKLPGDAPKQVGGMHAGRAYRGMLLERMYIVTCDEVAGVSIAATEEEVHGLGQAMIDRAFKRE